MIRGLDFPPQLFNLVVRRFTELFSGLGLKLGGHRGVGVCVVVLMSGTVQVAAHEKVVYRWFEINFLHRCQILFENLALILLCV